MFRSRVSIGRVMAVVAMIAVEMAIVRSALSGSINDAHYGVLGLSVGLCLGATGALLGGGMLRRFCLASFLAFVVLAVLVDALHTHFTWSGGEVLMTWYYLPAMKGLPASVLPPADWMPVHPCHRGIGFTSHWAVRSQESRVRLAFEAIYCLPVLVLALIAGLLTVVVPRRVSRFSHHGLTLS